MARDDGRDLARAVLDLHGQTYAEEIGLEVAKGTPSELFQLLVASLLFSARISADLAVRAAKALRAEGWTTTEKMAEATWKQRVKTLNESGYARYDERTSSMLGDTCEILLERYGGDLRKLREEADRDPGAERRLLKEFKGVGDVGVDIFFREVQVEWEEIAPFADRRATDAAKRLGLPADPEKLAALVAKKDFARLVAGLVRTGIDDDFDAVREAARS
jgi:endonuclease III